MNYAGEMFIIEEVQLFQPPVSIKILKFSNVTVSGLKCYHSLINGLLLLNHRSSVRPSYIMVWYISAMSLCLPWIIVCRVSSTQAQTMEQHRYHSPPVRGPRPVWTVCWPETHTVAGTNLLGNVLSFLVHKGRQLSQHASCVDICSFF